MWGTLLCVLCAGECVKLCLCVCLHSSNTNYVLSNVLFRLFCPSFFRLNCFWSVDLSSFCFISLFSFLVALHEKHEQCNSSYKSVIAKISQKFSTIVKYGSYIILLIKYVFCGDCYTFRIVYTFFRIFKKKKNLKG